MCSRALWPWCAPIFRVGLGAAALLLSCGTPDESAPGGELDALPAANLNTSQNSALAPSELSAPTQPSPGLLSSLGGQTGSEVAQGVPPPCDPMMSQYALGDVTPLGFAASSVGPAIASDEYWLSGMGDEGPVDVTVELTSPVAFFDRDPMASPELVCIDAVRIVATFSISMTNGDPLSFEIPLYADAPTHFAGQAWLAVASQQGALAAAARGLDVIVHVENQGDGTRVWFYRDVEGPEDELIGRVVPVR